jgi:teichuronic acid biosynthesis glycosyltransferase TuaC
VKVLFVTSGNSADFSIAPFIKAQGESLKKASVEVEYFPVSGKGAKGYIQAGLKLRKFLIGKKFDIIHAHYVLSGWSAVIGSGKIPVVISLMGSDAYGEYMGEQKVKFASRINTVLTYLIQPYVKGIVCKSIFIEKYVYRKKISHVIPNGVNITHFNPDHKVSRESLGLSNEKKYILFLGDKRDIRKNFQLAVNAVKKLNNRAVELLNPYPIDHDVLPHYFNASDILILTSFMEGSPNVIKEAMACNCPIVSTNVGDVAWVTENVNGCYLTNFTSEDVAAKINIALSFSDTKIKTEGRKRIMELGLDSDTVAKKLINVYEKVRTN